MSREMTTTQRATLTRFLRTAFILAVSISLLCLGRPTVAEMVEVDLLIGSPSDTENRVDVTVGIQFTYLNIPGDGQSTTVNDSQSTTVDVSGNILSRLWADFDPITQEVTNISGIEFYGGAFTFSTFEMDFNLTVLSPHVTLTGLGGEFDTPTIPGPIVGTQFDASYHETILNRGEIVSTALALPVYIADGPARGFSSGTGTVIVGSPKINGNTATYDVALTLPVNFDEDIPAAGFVDIFSSQTVHGTATGTYVSSGQITRTLVPEPSTLALLASLSLVGLLRRNPSRRGINNRVNEVM